MDRGCSQVNEEKNKDILLLVWPGAGHASQGVTVMYEAILPFHPSKFFTLRAIFRDEISACPVEVNTPRVRHVRAPLENKNRREEKERLN
jgi:hypothetical protein